MLNAATSGPRTISEALDAIATEAPESVFLLAPDRRPLTFAGLRAQVLRTRAALNAAGIGRGDRVALALPNGPEMMSAFVAVACSATCAPLNPAYPEAQFDFLLRDLRAQMLVLPAGVPSPARAAAEDLGLPVAELSVPEGACAGEFELEAPTIGVARRPGPAQPEDLGLVLHTSGTTSRPKLVPLAHGKLVLASLAGRERFRLTPADRLLAIMPLFHVHGLVGCVLYPLFSGGSVAAAPGFDAPCFFDWVARFCPTWVTAVPTMYQAILERAPDHAEVIARAPLRFLRSSSAALPVHVLHRLEATFGAPVVEGYGMTEMVHNVSSNHLPPGIGKPGSVGTPLAAEIAVTDASGNFLPPGVRGEIVARGPVVFDGYEGNPEANAEAFRDGWLRTGDEGYLDEDGYIFITGRITELIVRGGTNISPRAIDEVLIAHPAVRQALTFSLPDRRLGEDVAAAVVVHGEATTNALEIREFVAEHLPLHMVPREIVFVDEIPTTPTGKLKRIGLAEALGLGAEPDPQPPADYLAPRDDLEAALAEIWAEVLRVERVGVLDRFLDLGGDSVLAAQIAARVHDALATDFSLIRFLTEPTVAGQAAMLEEVLAAEP